MKTCLHCGQSKPITEFHKYKRSPDGVRARCKACRTKEYEARVGRKVKRVFKHASADQIEREQITGKRACRKCGKTKPLTSQFFAEDSRCKNGHVHVCRMCIVSYSTQLQQRLMKEDPGRVRGWQRAYRKNNPESALGRYQRYHKKHAVKIAIYDKKRRAEHPEKLKKWWQDWYAKNGEAHNRSQNARKRDLGAYVGVDTIRAIEQANIKKYGILTCEYCKVPVGDKYHLEHKTPISRGGRSQRVNLCIACPQCNLSKGTLTAEEYRERFKVI